MEPSSIRQQTGDGHDRLTPRSASLASLTERLTVSTTRTLERVRSNSSLRTSSHLSMDSSADSEDKSPKRAVLLEEENDDDSKTRGDASFKRAVRGEARLKIVFESLGSVGEFPQRCGRTGHQLIPHGLCGTHGMYEQPWHFEISHGRVVDPSEGLTLITWSVKNLVSRTVTSVTETPEEALSRLNLGRTICNRVVREALARRHAELAQMLSAEEDQTSLRAANIKSLMKSVGPLRRTVGLLFFGLLHEVVWTNLQRELHSRDQVEETKVSSPDASRSHKVLDVNALDNPFPPPAPIGYYDGKDGEEDDLFDGLELGSFPNDFVSSRNL